MAESKIDARIISISVALALSNLAICTHRSSRVYLFQQSLCLEYFRINDPARLVDGSNLEESLCKIPQVQSQLSLFEGADGILALMPAILALATYRDLLPIWGLRRLFQFNLCCSALAVTFSTIIFRLHRPWAEYALLASFLIDLLGGADAVRTIISIACVAAISPPGKLTTILNCLSSLYMLGSVIGSVFGTLLLSHHVYILNALSVLFFGVTFLITFSIPSCLGKNDLESNLQSPEVETSILDAEVTDPTRDRAAIMSQNVLSPHRPVSLPTSTDSFQTSILHIILRSWRSSAHTILHLFDAPNPTFTVLLLFLIFGFASRTELLLPQYISLRLHWSLATVNSALAVKELTAALILITLPYLRAKYLEPKLRVSEIDFLITKASLTAFLVGTLILGFPLPAPLFVVILCVYTSGIGFANSLTTLGTLTLPPGQDLADFYVRMGLIQTLAALVGAPLWSWIFSTAMKIDILPMGLPFWLSALLYGIGIGAASVLERWA